MKLWTHALFVALLAIAAAFLSMEEPQFGDDLTYWSYGFSVHESGLSAWTKDGFHQLRWPVWGLCWLAQGIFGYGLTSYYFTPMVVLVLGALCAFAVGWGIFRKAPHAWGCAILFIFHPLIDANLTRPYPDIGEGVLGACAIFAWWALMHAETKGRIAMASAACGVFLFLAEENRLTGVFFIPLLICLTIFFFRHKAARLIVPLAVFSVLLGSQMLFYHVKFGDALHFIHANSTAKGRSGTEAVEALWFIPFRFLGTLHKGSDLMSFYAVFGALGLWFGWRRHGVMGRVVVAWFILLYLAYACAPQQLWPFRPMLRVADRFLSALAIPYSILAAFGLAGVLGWICNTVRVPTTPITPPPGDGRQPSPWRERIRNWGIAVRNRPALSCASLAVLLAIASLQPIGNRGLFTMGYVPEFRAYMRNLPADSVVFTHRHTYVLAHLVDTETASRLKWIAEDKWITEPKPALVAKVEKATEFWYVRKLALMRFAKGIITEDENKKLTVQPPLASWFKAPEKEWQLATVMARSDTPDVILYRRRTASTPPPAIFTPESPEFKTLLPAFPFEWNAQKDKGGRDFHVEPYEIDWPLPPAFRGKLVRIEMQASSENRDALGIQISFGTGKKFDEPYTMKPYLFRDGGIEFACLRIPPDADKCKVRVRFAKNLKWVRVDSFRMIVD